MSKATTLSQNVSNEAQSLKFEVLKDNILVGNNQPYGSVTIEQTKNGFMHSNVQAAIDDIISLYTLPINTIITNTDGIYPTGVSQIDRYEFSGEVTDPVLPEGSVVKFNCFGFYTDVLVGDTAEEVASKVKITLLSEALKNNVFNEIIDGATLSVFEVRYNDTQNHYLNPIYQSGITLTPSILSSAKPGYGTWTRIGTETKTLDGSVEPVTIYYFKRDS